MDSAEFKRYLSKKNLKIAKLKKQLVALNDQIEVLKGQNTGLQAFYDYFGELYGQGLEIAYWHANGDLEPFDNFFDSAESEMVVDKPPK